MISIQIANKQEAKALLILIKSGFAFQCFPESVYRVSSDQMQLLKRNKIVFKRLKDNRIPLPKTSLAA